MAVTASVIDGGLLLLKVGGVTIGKATSHSLSVTANVRDITSKDSAGWTENLEGLRSWEVSGDGLYTFDATYAYDDLHALIISRLPVILLIARTEPKNADDWYFTGSAYLTSLSLETPNEGENSTYSYSFTGTGSLTKAVIT